MPGYHTLPLPDAYQALLTLDARGFAWEWLRRNPDYRAAWASTGVSVRRATTLAQQAFGRSARTPTEIPQTLSVRRWSPWGLGFPSRS